MAIIDLSKTGMGNDLLVHLLHHPVVAKVPILDVGKWYKYKTINNALEVIRGDFTVTGAKECQL